MRHLLIPMALGSVVACAREPERVASNTSADTRGAQSVDPNARWMADQDMIPVYPPPAPADNAPAPR
jgi:hypothetical protein